MGYEETKQHCEGLIRDLSRNWTDTMIQNLKDLAYSEDPDKAKKLGFYGKMLDESILEAMTSRINELSQELAGYHVLLDSLDKYYGIQRQEMYTEGAQAKAARVWMTSDNEWMGADITFPTTKILLPKVVLIPDEDFDHFPRLGRLQTSLIAEEFPVVADVVISADAHCDIRLQNSAAIYTCPTGVFDAFLVGTKYTKEKDTERYHFRKYEWERFVMGTEANIVKDLNPIMRPNASNSEDYVWDPKSESDMAFVTKADSNMVWTIQNEKDYTYLTQGLCRYGNPSGYLVASKNRGWLRYYYGLEQVAGLPAEVEK